jgi:(p)ppGpp synthase/HD superfamily hydrolase
VRGLQLRASAHQPGRAMAKSIDAPTDSHHLQAAHLAPMGDAIGSILAAVHFAADKHRDQRRKDAEASPYINHPIEVAELLARVGGIKDIATLQGALLHDTIEDTNTSPEELEAVFGQEVRHIVEEVTDDKRLPKEDRKRLQIEHAPHVSLKAQQIKLADKIANVRSVTEAPPAKWPLARRKEYLDWTEQVVAGLRGANPPLEALYRELLAQGRATLDRIKE